MVSLLWTCSLTNSKEGGQAKNTQEKSVAITKDVLVSPEQHCLAVPLFKCENDSSLVTLLRLYASPLRC